MADSKSNSPKGRGNVNTHISHQLGKLPPQALELEEAVLGALMIESNALNQVIDILRPESFYKTAYQEVYRAIFELFSESEPIDMLTVTQQLRKRGKLEMVGGASQIMRLTQSINSAANIEYHARIITEQAIKREMIAIATEVQRDAYDDAVDVFDLLDGTEQKIFQISETNIRKNFSTMSPLVQQAIKEIEARKDIKDGLTGIPTGFTSLDRITAGWQKSDLVILAARPGMGKTAFSLTAVRNAAVDFQHPVAFFSLEMSELQLVNRLIAAEAELEGSKIKTGNLAEYEMQQLYQKTAKIQEAPIFIDDTPALSVLELRAKCRRLKAQHDIQLIIVDYLQLMTANTGRGNQGNREQEIAMISRSLKNLAKELNVPVIALSQLSRAVETRGGDKRPQLSDLRESGCLTGDTLILDAESGQLTPIRQLAERQKQQEIKCLALNPNYKLSAHAMVKVFYSGKKKVYRLTTRSGRSIKASANHPFFKLSGWTRLDELQVGDRIAVPRQIKIQNPSNPLSESELILLAHLIGDGCILPRQPYHYTSADPANIDIVNQKAKALFGIEAKIVKQKNWWHTYLKCPYHLTHGRKHPITEWYEKLGLLRVRSYEKKLPSALFQCDEERIALFLHHLWATDGNISWKKIKGRKNSAAIYYATSSLELARQVQHLLLRLGIINSLKESVSKKGYRSMYHIHVMGSENQINFLKKISSFGERGKEASLMIAQLEEINSNLNYDVIPKEAWQSLITICKEEMGISWREFTDKIQMEYCGSSLFKSGISRERMRRIYQALPFAILSNLANSDLLWDEIISIEELGVEDVYDATVNEVHNFVANDIVVHNSIEQDADLVLFLYRPEYYGITQDMEGNATAGVGEVIIAKHRNGSLADVKLKFIGKYTKFDNLENEAFQGGGEGDQQKGKIMTFSSKANEPSQFHNPSSQRLDDDPPF